MPKKRVLAPKQINQDVYETLKSFVESLLPVHKRVLVSFDDFPIQSINGNLYPAHGDERTPDRCIILQLKFITINKPQILGTIFYFHETDKQIVALKIMYYIIDLFNLDLCVLATQSSGKYEMMQILSEFNWENSNDGVLYHTVKEYDKIIHLFDTSWMMRNLLQTFRLQNVSYKINNMKQTASFNHILASIKKSHSNSKLNYQFRKNLVTTPIAVKVFSTTTAKIVSLHSEPDINEGDTADFCLLFDQLYDSLNGNFEDESSKPFRTPLKYNSIHHSFWRYALSVLKTMHFNVPNSTYFEPMEWQTHDEEDNNYEKSEMIKKNKLKELMEKLNENRLKNEVDEQKLKNNLTESKDLISLYVIENNKSEKNEASQEIKQQLSKKIEFENQAYSNVITKKKSITNMDVDVAEQLLICNIRTQILIGDTDLKKNTKEFDTKSIINLKEVVETGSHHNKTVFDNSVKNINTTEDTKVYNNAGLNNQSSEPNNKSYINDNIYMLVEKLAKISVANKKMQLAQENSTLVKIENMPKKQKNRIMKNKQTKNVADNSIRDDEIQNELSTCRFILFYIEAFIATAVRFQSNESILYKLYSLLYIMKNIDKQPDLELADISLVNVAALNDTIASIMPTVFKSKGGEILPDYIVKNTIAEINDMCGILMNRNLYFPYNDNITLKPLENLDIFSEFSITIRGIEVLAKTLDKELHTSCYKEWNIATGCFNMDEMYCMINHAQKENNIKIHSLVKAIDNIKWVSEEMAKYAFTYKCNDTVRARIAKRLPHVWA